MVPGMKSAECNMLQIVEIFLIRVSSNYILKKAYVLVFLTDTVFLKTIPLLQSKNFRKFQRKKTVNKMLVL